MSPIAAQLRTERYYYDGQRRIAEDYTDPLGSPDGKPLTMVSERGGGVPGSIPDPNGYYRWTGREYIWGPDGNDELLAQIDAGHWPWLVITDGAPSFTPQLLIRGEADNGQVPTQPAGRPVAQYTWHPYGSLTGLETLAPHNALWVGHHGRFFLRFDGDGAANPLTPTAKGVYHARNRVYDPWLGRFLQADPNGTGTPVAVGVAVGVWCQGERPQALAAQADAKAMVTDGLNRYAFCGADPVNATDPMGLFVGFVNGLMTGLDMADSTSDAMEQAYCGVGTLLGLGAMIDGYSIWQQYDVDWAMDWTTSDDGYSSSATIALYNELAEEQGNQLAMAGGRGPGSLSMQIGRMSRAVGRHKPSIARINAGLQKVQLKLGGSPPRTDPARFGSPQWSDGVRGYRLDPPHPPRPGRDAAECDWHINWWDNSTGQKGTIPL